MPSETEASSNWKISPDVLSGQIDKFETTTHFFFLAVFSCQSSSLSTLRMISVVGRATLFSAGGYLVPPDWFFPLLPHINPAEQSDTRVA